MADKLLHASGILKDVGPCKLSCDDISPVGDNEIPPDYYIILLLKQSANWKDRIGEIGRLFGEMASMSPLKVPEHNGKHTEMKILLQQAQVLRALGNFVGYFLNCSSWHNAEKYPEMLEYDQQELLRKFKQVELTLKNNK
jgi:hypothetical protein